MHVTTEKLKKFFEEARTLSLWKRVFRWSPFRDLSFEAHREFNAVVSELELKSDEIRKVEQANSILKNTNEHVEAHNRQHNVDLTAIREKLGFLQNENARLSEENVAFRESEKRRAKTYEERAATLTTITTQIQTDRQREIEDRQRTEIERLQRQKETWTAHEARVRETIRAICQKHTIEYMENVPFKGNPDNTIKLCDEYIIFDAKSPGSEDIGNFFGYIKLQTESVKKYIKEENVKREIYLVIPSNTVDVIEKTVFNMADYHVYVVTLDVLEPLILALKKLEDYEFVDQLSPEERDNICRVVGRFAHMTKRKIQIDQFFEHHFLEILSKAEADLPVDVFEKAAEYERAEKLNPPQEKRSKVIPIKALQSGSQQIRKEAEAKNIAFPSSAEHEIARLPLYTDDKPEPSK